MFNFSKCIVGVLLLGVIDQVHDNAVLVELSSSDGEISSEEMPVWMFPCEVAEGDLFYVEKIEDVLEIRCGEPPE